MPRGNGFFHRHRMNWFGHSKAMELSDGKSLLSQSFLKKISLTKIFVLTHNLYIMKMRLITFSILVLFLYWRYNGRLILT